MDTAPASLAPLPFVRARQGDDLADTLLRFGYPILSVLPEAPDAATLEGMISLVVSVWNAHAASTPAWHSPDRLIRLRELAVNPAAPAMTRRMVVVLSSQREAYFAGDERLVARVDLRLDGETFCLACVPFPGGPTDESDDPEGEDRPSGIRAPLRGSPRRGLRAAPARRCGRAGLRVTRRGCTERGRPSRRLPSLRAFGARPQ